MKLRSILCGVLAIAAAVACKPDDVVETPKLDVDKTAVSVTAEAGQATFNVTTNQDWTASADADWVSVNPNNGKASDKAVAVKVTAEDNATEAERTATVTVKAGTLSKTVKVTQAAKAVTPDPGPDPEPETYILVGEAVGGWDVDKNGVVLTLKEGYYEARGISITAKKGMHFTKNNKWEGNVKGLHGLIAPDEIGEVGNNDISLTDGGSFDVYLAEALDKFYFMTPGKTPSDAVEHQDIAVVWGVCGALEGNSWGASADPEMTQEGEWYVAKNIAFTEVNFKVRGNNSWADDLKWGTAAKGQTCELNSAIAVSNCTDYKANNPSEGDNPNIYISAPAGAYDIYFSPEKKEVWVMAPGYKPGEEVPGGDQPVPEYTLDGRQWIAEVDGMQVLFDFGITQEEMMCVAFPLMDGSGFGLYMAGLYEIVPTDATSGVVVYTSYDWEWDEFGDPVEMPYSDLSATSVKIISEGVFGVTDPISFTAVENPYEIVIEGGNGGSPSGPVEDGDYWFFNSGKVMAPLAEGVTSGVLPAEDAVDGASTAKNVFTLTYDPDMSYYTIQDSYGRYLGQTDETGNITVTDVLPTDETYGYYLWCVEPGYGEACDIYSAAYYFDLTYSAADNNWVLMDGGYEFPEILPVLVKAEN